MSAAQREYLDTLENSAELLLHLLDDTLDLAKIEAGKLHLEAVEFALRESLAGFFAALVLGARQRGLELRCQIAPQVPDHLVGDPLRLRQVLLNLVSNAIKFTEHGEVEVQIEGEEAGAGQVELRVRVRDTGIGIPPAKLPQVFEAFTQADLSTTRRYGGTGLGLAISWHLVQLMDGRIWVESQEGRGSTFYFTARLGVQRGPVDAANEQAAATAAPPVPSAASRLLRLLVVEDNPLNQQVARGLLEQAGHTVVVAQNGRQALAVLGREVFDGVLMDVQMPGMDGLEITAAIRRQEQTSGRHMPIVGLTAHAVKGDRERFLAAGMDDYLAKPVRRDQLLAVLARLTTGSGPGSNLAAQTQASRAIDPEALAGLAALQDGGHFSLQAFLGLFVEDGRHRLATMRRAAAAGDAPALQQEAHTLEGSAGDLGARHLAATCRALAELARSGSTARAAALLEQAEEAFGQARAQVEEELRRRG